MRGQAASDCIPISALPMRVTQRLSFPGLLRLPLIWSTALCACIVGCGDGRIDTYPVTGTVLVDGRPAEKAMVIFCPADAAAEVENLRPAGVTDASGKFNLITFEAGDGAPAGSYKVLVKWPAPSQGEDRGGRQSSIGKGPDRLKGRYYNLESTPLNATVEEQSNELPPFELTSR
jgi:hypothetical protein